MRFNKATLFITTIFLFSIMVGCKSEVTSQSNYTPVKNGNVCVGSYIRFDCRYYKLINQNSLTKSDISSKLSEDLFSIKNVSPSKSILLQTHDAFFRYNFVFSDSFCYQNCSYVLNPLETVVSNYIYLDDTSLGKLYRLSNPTDNYKVAVLIGKDYIPAIQMPSQIIFEGKKYDLQLALYDVAGLASTKCIGQVGSYKIYRDLQNSSRILVNINKRCVVEAIPVLN